MNIILRRRKLGLTSCNGIREKSGYRFEVIRHDTRQNNTQMEVGTCIRWGCTADVRAGTIINTAAAIHEVNNKAEFRKKLSDAGLAPLTWNNCLRIPVREYEKGIIVRPLRHAQGRRIGLVNDAGQASNYEGQWGACYYSQYIRKVAEYRVFVVSGRAVAVAQKTPAHREQLAWNVARGGRFDNVGWGDWPLKAVKKSIEAFNLSQLDFGGVDVMVDADNNVYVLEINSAPSLTSDYRQECFAKAFNYIVANGKARIPLPDARGGYRKFIHPAVCEEARMP